MSLALKLKRAKYARKLAALQKQYARQLEEGWDIVLPPPIDAIVPDEYQAQVGNWAYQYCQIPFIETALKNGHKFQRKVYICTADTGALSRNKYLSPYINADLAHDHTGSGELYDEHGHFSHCKGINLAKKDGANLGLLHHPLIPIDYFVGFGRKVLSKYGSGSYTWIEQFGDKLIDDIRKKVIPEDAAVIVNMSFGGGGTHAGVERVMNELRSMGVFLHASSGNANGPVGFPAKLASVFAIGAHDQDEKRAPFSNFGPELFASGAGVGITSTGDGEDELLTWSGTSMAGPTYGANMALLLSMAPDIRNMDDLEAFLADGNLKDVGEPGRDDYFGHGIARLDYLVDEPIGGDPPPPPPPPEPEPPKYDYPTPRITRLELKGQFRMWWRTMGGETTGQGTATTMLESELSFNEMMPIHGYTNTVALEDLVLVLETKSFAAPAAELHEKLTKEFFANGKRGVIMPQPADAQDAAEWGLFFLKLLANKEGGEIVACAARATFDGVVTEVTNRV